MKLKRHGGSLNHPKENADDDRDNKTKMSRAALSAYPKMQRGRHVTRSSAILSLSSSSDDSKSLPAVSICPPATPSFKS